MLINRAINTIMQSELIGKVLQHEAFIESILKAVTASLEARDALGIRYEQLLKSVGLVTTEQLSSLQEMLDSLNQEAEALREQLDRAALTHRELRQRAESAEKELESLRTELKAAREALSSHSKDQSSATASSKESSQVTWTPTMTKAELLEIAKSLGLRVSGKIKKTDLISRLSQAQG